MEFVPEHYELNIEPKRDNNTFSGHVIISGRKAGRPSHRITLHQKGLKITDAQIVRRDKKGDQQFKATRINHLPTFSEVRIHTKEILYPGKYQVDLHYKLSSQKAKSLAQRSYGTLQRDLLPCIDEPPAWATSSIEIINSSGK